MTFSAEFTMRDLRDSEVSDDAPNRRSHIQVVEPGGDLSANRMRDSFRENSEEILRETESQGALLFRNWPIHDVEMAESLVLDLGIAMDNQYLGGASPRSAMTRYLFSSTEAPSRYIISCHTEMCYLRQRPSRIIFYCVDEPRRYGETSVFDCARMYRDLDPTLRNRLDSEGLVYERTLGSKKSALNVYKTWGETFHADTKEEAEAGCRAQGLKFQWADDDRLITRAKMPGTMEHPRSGERCLSVTLYNEHASVCDMRRFKHRYNPLIRLVLGGVSRFAFGRKNPFFRTLWGNGDSITRDETQALIDCAWNASTLFRWRKGDLLLLDNIRSGHGRLNVIPPRRIAAGLGDPYELDASVGGRSVAA